MMTMKPRAGLAHVAVHSSSVASVGYSSDAETLEVRFCSGAMYRYFGVPHAVFDLFLAASSKGTFFNEVVRGRFGFARV